MSDRLLIVGWDGADWEILDDLLGRGLLPNVANLVATGVRGRLNSTIPAHSWSAWSSFLTGMHPAGHGVYDFVERDPSDPQRRIPVTSTSIKAATFLERLSRDGHEVRCGNVPVTYPPIPIRGRMISGVAIPRNGHFVFPAEWARQLERRAPFPINGMEWQRFRSSPMALVDEAERFVEQRTRSFEVMLEGDWTVAVCVYVAPDRLQHAMGSSLLPSHPSYPRHSNSEMAVRVRQVFSLLDAALARLHRVAGEGTTIVLMSDHGFRPVTRTLNLNLLLAELGLATRSVSGSVARALTRSKFARLAANTAVGRKARRLFRAPSTVDWSTTVAYESATGGGISLNLRGREPAGIVDPERYHETRDDVRDRLLGYRDPETDEAPITGVRTRDEIPSGPFQALAPDLIAFPAPLWVFAPNGGLPAPTAWPSGAHRSEGVIAAAGRRVPRGHLADHDMPDLAATALAFAGVPATGLDGRTIEEIAGRLLGEGGPSRPVISRSSDRMSPREEDEVAQHLRNLGYIE